MDVVETQWRDIRSTIGVSHFISFDDYPAPLPDGIVEAIIAREDGEGYVGLFHEHKKGQTVEIVGGPMANISTIFDCADGLIRSSSASACSFEGSAGLSLISLFLRLEIASGWEAIFTRMAIAYLKLSKLLLEAFNE
jgi:hypothetical protein